MTTAKPDEGTEVTCSSKHNAAYQKRVEAMTSPPKAAQSPEGFLIADPNGPESPRRIPYPGTEGAPTEAPGDMSHMIQIKTMIDDLTAIHTRFGNTCVYIRRRGLSWGAVALNYRANDEKHGIFDIQAEHDRKMLERAQQVERLIADRDEHRDARWALEKEIEPLRLKSPRPPVLSPALITEISKRHNARDSCPDHDETWAEQIGGQAHLDCASLLHFIRDQHQPVLLTNRDMAEMIVATEFLKARPAHNPISDLMLAIRHLKNTVKIIDRLTQTPG